MFTYVKWFFDEGIKKLMQPAITIWALWLGGTLIASGQFGFNLPSGIVVGVIGFWLGDTFIKKITEIALTGTGILPKANGGGTVETPYKPPEGYKVDGSKIEPDPEPVVITPIPFNAENLMSEVKEAIIGNNSPGYQDPMNDYTIFAKAKQIIGRGGFNNLQAVKDAYSFLLTLAEKAFTFVWGCDYATALAKLGTAEGCPKCPGSVTTCAPKTIEALAAYSGIPFQVVLNDLKEVNEWVNSVQ
jgi:hypothetical protein